MNNFEALIVNADAGRIPLPDGVVHCTVTSPPYWGLRAYEGEQDRDWPEVTYSPSPGLHYDWLTDEQYSIYGLRGKPAGRERYKLTIPAMRCALGAEDTPEAFIGHLVLCFREVKRVLREDGVFWCVVGDSYNSNASNQNGTTGDFIRPSREGAFLSQGRRNKAISTLHQGDLLGIPFMLWKALQADGWIVRNDVVWHKVAPMPESVQGARWERHRVRDPEWKERRYGGKGEDPQSRTERLKMNVASAREAGIDHERGAVSVGWSDCPGCAKCAKHGGYVLRRGSWRHTRSHETVLMCVKSMGYFADQERVREAQQGDGRQRGHVTTEYRGEKAGRNDGGRQAQDTGYRNPRDVLSGQEQLVQLREDLPEEQRQYVIAELQRRGLL